MFNKPHGYGKYTNPAPRPKTPTEDAEDTLLASPSKSSTTSSFSPSTPKDEKTSKPENDKSDRKSKQGQKSTVSKDPENKPRASDNDDEPEITLPISKKDLLRMVRVFTLGSHHESGCEIYSEEVEEFMQGVEILRILETPCAPHRTFHICENCPGGSCPLIDTLNPRKIVVRNVSGLSVPFPAMWKANSKQQQVKGAGLRPSHQDDVVHWHRRKLHERYLGQLTVRAVPPKGSSSRSWASSPEST